jgi:nitroreductase
LINYPFPQSGTAIAGNGTAIDDREKIRHYDTIRRKAVIMKRYPLTFLAAFPLFLACGMSLGAQSAAADSRSNPVVDSILRSGTTRSFSDQPVDSAVLEVIVQCGIRAPSAQNAQPWHFSVVTGREMLGKLKGSMSQGQQGRRDPFFGASTIIVISGKKDWQWSQFDCALACENMSLAAQSFGLGTHISASAVMVFNDPKTGPELKKALGIPDNMVAVAVLVIGVPDTKTDAVSSASARNSTGVSTYVK